MLDGTTGMKISQFREIGFSSRKT